MASPAKVLVMPAPEAKKQVRRDPGDGSVYQPKFKAKDGTVKLGAWRVRFWWIDREKKRHLYDAKVPPQFYPDGREREIGVKAARDFLAKEKERLYGSHCIQSETFRQRATTWLDEVKNRRRDPVKPATIAGWSCYLDKWLLPNLGDMLLADVNNPAVKELVSKMVAAKLSPKTILNVVQTVKMVVASATDDDGAPLYPRTWNHEKIDLPKVVRSEQHTPTFTAEEVTKICAAATGQYRALFTLLGATGLRIGEALGLEVRHVVDDTVRVEQSVWKGVVQTPKTPNALREIDFAPELAKFLRSHIGGRTSGFLFHAGDETKPLASQSMIEKRYLHPALKELGINKAGFHAFRRFRTTFLRKNRTPEDLIKFWLGHAEGDVTDGYSKLSEDTAFRKECAVRIGCGFEVPEPFVKSSSKVSEVSSPEFVVSC